MATYTGKAIITTFFYKQQTCLEYCNSLVATVLAMNDFGLKFEYWPISGNFHMEMCVNSTLTKFLNDKEATDIIIVDSDESWMPESLIGLLLHDVEMVAGVYLLCDPQKKEYPVVLEYDKDGSHIGKILKNGNCLLKADRVPAGFLRISKTALQKWIDAFPDDYIGTKEDRMYNFFRNDLQGHCFTGMDWVFSDLMKKAGVQIWVDPMCNISHWGIVPFKGTLDASLRALKEEQNG